MGNEIEVHLFGSLHREMKGDDRFPVTVRITSPSSLSDILHMLNIPPERIQLVMINHRAVNRETTIRPGDRVALFPGEYPFFADWKDFRY